MILSAPLLTTLQRCERRLSLESTHRVVRLRPKDLFDRLLREAIFAVSQGEAPRAAAESAHTLFLEAAADPGLEVLSDPYTLVMDYAAIFRTVLETVSREVLLVVKRSGVITIGEHGWEVQAFRDESGILHRWTSVDRWDYDAKLRELHSWHVYGDCVATGQGMWLHVVEIGRQSNGHQQTPWCRCFKHPAIAKHFRFRHVDGGPLQGGWKPVYYQDSSENDPKTWVDLMERDNVKSLHHMQIRDPDPAEIKKFRADVPRLVARLQGVGTDWESITMERTACDIPPCPWQPVCYAPGPVNIEGVGGFLKL